MSDITGMHIITVLNGARSQNGNLLYPKIMPPPPSMGLVKMGGGQSLETSNPYQSLRVILAEARAIT